LSYLPPVVQALLALVVIIAGVSDFRSRRVPNWLTFSGVFLGVALNAFLSYDLPGQPLLWASLKGLGVALAVYLPLYMLRGMGAGDVKLMAAVGAIAGGPGNWLGILVLTSIFGALAAIILVTFKHRFRQTFQNIWVILISLRHRQAPFENNPQLDVRSDQAIRLPHAVVIACGTLSFLVAAAIWAPR
jgi:prepilin peptidase CpaA